MYRRLDHFADIHYGKSPSLVIDVDGTIPVYGTGGVYAQASTPLFPGPAVIVPRKGSLDSPHLASGPFWASDTTYAVIPKRGVDPHWLYYQLCVFELEKPNEATGVPSISRDWLAKIDIANQDEPKQAAAVAQIQCVEQQITHTEALIAKQEQVRAGLMQDLFTRGVDEIGRLRPPREEAPELYHETALGWLPKGWEVTPLENLLAPVTPPMRSGPFGSALRAHELVEAGVPLLGIDNIYVEYFQANFSRFVSPAKASELLRYRAFPGDVVITIMGTVGRACVIPEGYGQLLSSKHLWTMTFDTARVVPRLIAWQLNFATWVNAWFRKETQGGIMDAIQSSTLRTLRLPVPPPLEQNLIAERYDAATNLLSQLRAELEKLGRMRTALLRDLLTPTYTAAEPRIAAE